MIVKLYKCYVRPKLEYAQSIWKLCYIKDIELSERIQRVITRLPIELKELPYESRLNWLLLYLTTYRQNEGKSLRNLQNTKWALRK